MQFHEILTHPHIFKFSNRYRVTPKLSELYQSYIQERMRGGNKGFKRTSIVYKLLDHIRLENRKLPTKSSSGKFILNRPTARASDTNPQKIQFYEVFRFLCAMGKSTETDYPRHEDDYLAEDDEPTIKDLLEKHDNVKRLCDVRKLCEYAREERVTRLKYLL